MNQRYFYNILLTRPFTNLFTYSSDSKLDKGQVVKVPFNRGSCNGVICTEVSDLSIDINKVKDISEGLDYRIKSKYLDFMKFCAQYNMVHKGNILKMMISHIDALKKPSRYLKEVEGIENVDKKLVELNDEQTKVFEAIFANIYKFNVSVLQGVTGSGKTEVYLNLAAEIIKKGGQVLILLPEIALGSQLIQRYKERLGIEPLVWNSQEGQKSKKITWYNSVIKNYPLIVGARSALFLPYNNLKMIIVDEEHDQSFKQEEGAVYNARDMSVVLAKYLDIPLILSSATPSIETIYNVRKDKYSLYKISSRFGGSVLPEIEIIDTKKEKLEKGRFISDRALEAIREVIENGNQVLLYLNRRGYAPVSFCGSCGYKYECPKCSANLVKHKHNNFLQCHYCGHKTEPIKSCVNCGVEGEIFNYGPGVERIQDEISEVIPDAKTLLFSSDSLKANEVSNVVEDIRSGNYNIIIGTQMITKGFHFPKLKVVLILDFDWSIKGFDLRAHEKVYQSLYQVSGRAGREGDRGKVLVQTMEPDNYLLEILKECTHAEFVDEEISDREHAKMPPVSSIGLVNFEAFSEKTIIGYMRDLVNKVERLAINDIKVLGPSPTPIFKLRNKFRYRFVVISYKKGSDLQNFIAKWLNSTPKPKSLKIKIDIDPISFS